MCDYWDTKEAQTKSATTSAARMFDSIGVGPHKHVSKPMSYIQVELEMVVTSRDGKLYKSDKIFPKSFTFSLFNISGS